MSVTYLFFFTYFFIMHTKSQLVWMLSVCRMSFSEGAGCQAHPNDMSARCPITFWYWLNYSIYWTHHEVCHCIGRVSGSSRILRHDQISRLWSVVFGFRHWWLWCLRRGTRSLRPVSRLPLFSRSTRYKTMILSECSFPLPYLNGIHCFIQEVYIENFNLLTCNGDSPLTCQ